MSDELKIKINIDADTKGLKVVNDGLKDVGTKANVSDSEIAKLNNRIKDMAHIGVSVYSVSQAFDFLKTTLGGLASSGIEYNKTMEEIKNSLTTLEVITTRFKDGTSVADKYAYGQMKVADAVKKLQAINADTPHNLTQTIQLYKAMYAGMKNHNVTTDEMIDLTKKLSIATDGMEFNSVLAGIDGLATGTVEINSEFGRFMSTLGLTNEKLKASKDIYGDINKVLKDVQGFDSYGTALSNLTNQFDTLKGKATEGLFDGLKVAFKELGDDIKNLSDKDIQGLTSAVNTASIGMMYGLIGVGGAVGSVMYAFDSIKTIFVNLGITGEYAFLSLKEAWLETVYEISKSANAYLPDMINKKIGLDTTTLKTQAKELLSVQREMSGLEIKAGKNLIEHYDFGAGINTTLTKASKFVDTFSKNLDAKVKDKKEEIGKGDITLPNTPAGKTQKQLDEEEKARKKISDEAADAILRQVDIEIEADKDRLQRWDNYATTMSEITWNQLDNEIKADEKATEAENKKFEAQHKANNDNIELNNKINSLITDTYIKETLAENNKLELIKEQLDYQLQKKEISEEYYKKALDTEKDLSKARQKEIEDKKKLNSTAGQFMASLTSDSLKSAAAGAFVDALQNGTSIQQGLAKAGIGMGGNTLAMGMATGNVGMMGAGLAIGAVGALLEKPTETLISQENYLSELTNYSKSILEETKAFRILNKIFDTSYQSDTKSFLTAYGRGYTLNTQVGADMQNYIEGLYSEVANATQTYLVKTGERTVQKTKSGFLGIGASSSTEVQDVWGTYTGQQLSAMEFLSQFGVDGKGGLTADGLSALTNAFNAYNDLVTKLDEYAPNATDVQKLEVALSKIDVNSIKDEMYQTYSNQLAKVGINLAELTIDNIDEAFNATTLGELIKNDPSLNVSQLTSYVSSLNDTYLQQIELTKQLNEAKEKETLSMIEYQKELQDYQDKIDSLSITSVNSYTSVFKTIISSIKSMKDATKSTIDLLGKQDIDRFWELNNQFKGYLDTNNYEEASRVFSSLTQLSQNLSQTDAILGGNIATYLSDNMQIFEAKESELRNVIGSGIADLLNFSEAQTTKLGEIIADGKVSKEELSTLNLSDAATLDLQNALADSGLVTVENLLSSINEYSFMQLAELKKANANESDALSVDTFGYLDYIGTTEQFNIASTLGKSYKEVENFILGLQSFDIKNSAEDLEQLKAMINYSFDSATGKITYDQTAVTDISKLWDVLPQDVKDAYGALSALATQSQEEFLSGKSGALTSQGGALSKEQQDIIDTTKTYNDLILSITSKIPLIKDAYTGGGGRPSSTSAESVAEQLGVDKSLISLQSHSKQYSGHRVFYTTLDDAKTKANIEAYYNNILGTELSTQQTEANTAQAQYNDLLNFINSYTLTQLPSYDIGTSYVRGNQIAQIQDTEMIIDPQSSEVLRKYGIATNVNVSGNNAELVTAINKLISIQTKILRINEEQI